MPSRNIQMAHDFGCMRQSAHAQNSRFPSAVSRVRAAPELAYSTLIAITGDGQQEDKQKAFAAGFDRHLVKPVSTAKLAALLRAP